MSTEASRTAWAVARLEAPPATMEYGFLDQTLQQLCEGLGGGGSVELFSFREKADAPSDGQQHLGGISQCGKCRATDFLLLSLLTLFPGTFSLGICFHSPVAVTQSLELAGQTCFKAGGK